MGLFKRNREKVKESKSKYTISNERLAAACPKEAITSEEPSVEAAEPQEEWIWVEGYKGTDKDMKAHGDFQYELNKQYDYEGEIKICKQGYHFSRDLSDVFRYYDVKNSNRFFKVKALVRKQDYEKYGTKIKIPMPSSLWGTYDFRYEEITKLVAKSIILEEELSTTEIITTYLSHIHSVQLPEKYWDVIIREGHSVARENWQIDKLIEAGYSFTFAKAICYEGKAEKALAIADQEGVSMDMKVWYIYH